MSVIISEKNILNIASDAPIEIDLDSFKKIRLLKSEKITLVMIVWMLVMFFMTGEEDLEVFFVLMLIGMLLVREFADDFITVHLKHRMDGFIYVFLIIFIVITGEILISF
jgi:hypothetical protein